MKKKGRINWIAFDILLILAGISLVMSLYIFPIYQRNAQEKTVSGAYDKYIVMITDNRDASFWQSVYQGACAEAEEKNVYVELMGEDLTQNYSREELMQIAALSDVDGIIVEADESERMAELIDEAAAEGIPVVTVYGDNTQSRRFSFVGIGSYNMGREYGSQVLELAQGREKLWVSVLVSANKSDSSQNILCSGIKETLEKEKESGAEIEMTFVTVDDTSMFSTEEAVRNIFMKFRQPDIIICLDELSTVCVYQAVVDYNKVGEVNILGYYDSETILRAIDRNVIHATISVDTEQMGRYCLDALSDYWDYGNTSQYYMADVKLINKENWTDGRGGSDENEDQ